MCKSLGIIVNNYILAFILIVHSNFVVADTEVRAKNTSLYDVSYVIELSALEKACEESELNDGEPDEFISDDSSFNKSTVPHTLLPTIFPKSNKRNYHPQKVRAPPVSPLN